MTPTQPILLLSFASAAHALPVKLNSDHDPVPARDALLSSLSAAVDPDAAADALLIHYNDHGFPAVGVEVEDRHRTRHVDIDVAKFGNIWLSDGPPRTKQAATHHFGQLSGRFVNQNEINSLLNGFHANPLHRAIPRLQPSADGTQVNALLRIEQSKPHRFSTGYHDTGASPLPRERVWFQSDFSDLWGRSSLESARLTLAPDPSRFHSLQVSSRQFQKNGSEIGVTLAYTGASGEGATDFNAYTWQAAAHWKSTTHAFDDWRLRYQLGLAFRRTNNALEFGTNARGLAEVFQINADQEWERRARKSLTLARASLVLSPGGLGARGDDTDHATLRPGAQSEYALLRTNLWHRQDLPGNWDVIISASGQWASDPIIQADQIALGGASGIRGLSEQFALGDQGIIGGLELRTPTISPSQGWRLRPSLFAQAGETRDLINNTNTSAITTGIRLQVGWQEHLRASVHAGWRLDESGNELHTQLTWHF